MNMRSSSSIRLSSIREDGGRRWISPIDWSHSEPRSHGSVSLGIASWMWRTKPRSRQWGDNEEVIRKGERK